MKLSSGKLSSGSVDRDQSRGATMTEFAMVLPIFFLLVFGFFDIARYWQSKTALGQAAADAANRAVVDINLKKKWSATAEDQQTYQDAMDDLEQYISNRVSSLMLPGSPGGTQLSTNVTYPASYEDSQTVPVTVEISANYAPIVPLLLPSNIRIRSTVVGYIEPIKTTAEPIPVDCFGRLYDSFSPPGSGDYNKGCPCAKGGYAYSDGGTTCFCNGETGVNDGTVTMPGGECGCPADKIPMLGFDWGIMAGYGWSTQAIAGANAASMICCPTGTPLACPGNQVRPANPAASQYSCNCSCGPDAAPDVAGNCQCSNPHEQYTVTMGNPTCECTLEAADCPAPATLDTNACACSCPNNKIFDENTKTCICNPATVSTCSAGPIVGSMSPTCECACPANSHVENGSCSCNSGWVENGGACVCDSVNQNACDDGSVSGNWNSTTCACSCPSNGTLTAGGFCACNTSLKSACESSGSSGQVAGVWADPGCTCNCPTNSALNPQGKCICGANRVAQGGACVCNPSHASSCESPSVPGSPAVPGVYNSSTCVCSCPNGGTVGGTSLQCICPSGQTNQGGTCGCNATLASGCGTGDVSGTWTASSCKCACPSTSTLNSGTGQCICRANLATACTSTGASNLAGTWSQVGCQCSCPAGTALNASGQCACPTGQVASGGVCVCNPTNQSNCGSSSATNVPGTWNGGACSCSCPAGSSLSGGKCVCGANRLNVGDVCVCDSAKQTGCTVGGANNVPGSWNGSTCACSCPAGSTLNSAGQCLCPAPKTNVGGVCVCDSSLQAACGAGDKPGTWNSTTCSCACPAGTTLDGSGYCRCSSALATACTTSGPGQLAGSWSQSGCLCTCPAGSALNASGQCVCPQGQSNQAGACGCTESVQTTCTGGPATGSWNGSNCSCSCPANSTLSGGACNCNPTFVSSSGSCQCPAGKINVNGSCQCDPAAQASCQNSGGNFNGGTCSCACSGDKTLSQDGLTCACPAATHGFTLVEGPTTCNYQCQNKNGVEYTVISGYCVNAELCHSQCNQFYDDGTCSGCPNG